MTHNPSGEETRQALAAFLEDQQGRKSRWNAPPPPPRDWSRIKLAAAVFLAAVAIWFVWAPPAGLRPAVPAPTPEAVETGLHMDIYVAATQVMAYRARHGRLPSDLVDALAEPGAAQDLTYTVSVGDFFEIRGARAGQRVVYYSHRSLAEFVAEARAAVQAGNASRE